MVKFSAGHRIGKGEGFADLEFAMLVKMNAVNENTVIVTTVHDDQVGCTVLVHYFCNFLLEIVVQ